MKRILALALVLSLAGCATLNADIAKLQQVYSLASTTSVPASTALVVANGYDVLVAGATQFLRYCKSSPVDPRCSADTRRKVILYVRQGRAARNQIESAGITGQPISSTIYNLVVAAVNNLTATPAATFGVAK
jgi:hypothetical protein